MFIAHKRDINSNYYKPVAQLENKFIITSAAKLVSNVCPHQNSLISLAPGSGTRVCPYHSWSFDLEGQPIGSGRTLHYCKNSNPLATELVYEWNSLFFNIPVDLDLSIDFSSMQLVEQRIDSVKAIPDIIMDLFLDVDHIVGVHAGVYDQIGLVNVTEVDWQFYDWGSVQVVPNKQGIGAVWMAIYPGTMIEWQPGALFITVVKETPHGSDVHVFKYKDTNYSDSHWKLNESVWETAWFQDRSQAEIIVELPVNNLEESKQHYRKWKSLKITT